MQIKKGLIFKCEAIIHLVNTIRFMEPILFVDSTTKKEILESRGNSQISEKNRFYVSFEDQLDLLHDISDDSTDVKIIEEDLLPTASKLSYSGKQLNVVISQPLTVDVEEVDDERLEVTEECVKRIKESFANIPSRIQDAILKVNANPIKIIMSGDCYSGVIPIVYSGNSAFSFCINFYGIEEGLHWYLISDKVENTNPIKMKMFDNELYKDFEELSKNDWKLMKNYIDLFLRNEKNFYYERFFGTILAEIAMELKVNVGEGIPHMSGEIKEKLEFILDRHFPDNLFVDEDSGIYNCVFRFVCMRIPAVYKLLPHAAKFLGGEEKID